MIACPSSCSVTLSSTHPSLSHYLLTGICLLTHLTPTSVCQDRYPLNITTSGHLAVFEQVFVQYECKRKKEKYLYETELEWVYLHIYACVTMYKRMCFCMDEWLRMTLSMCIYECVSLCGGRNNVYVNFL